MATGTFGWETMEPGSTKQGRRTLVNTADTHALSGRTRTAGITAGFTHVKLRRRVEGTKNRWLHTRTVFTPDLEIAAHAVALRDEDAYKACVAQLRARYGGDPE